MAMQKYYIKNGSGAIIIPVADATWYTDLMEVNDSQNTQVYAEFYSDALGATPVTPTGGTITVYGSPMGGIYLTPTNVSVITAAQVSTPTATYTVPYFTGRCYKGKAVLSSIAGASYVSILFWRYT